MNAQQKALLQRMRDDGVGYAAIAQELGISRNTIKSYCRRNNLGILKNTAPDMSHLCKQCGKPLKLIPKHKPKKFCNDKCRLTWWSANKNMLHKKAVYRLTCAGCGKTFESYGNKNRKYCSHHCYIIDRFGEPENSDSKGGQACHAQ